MCGMKLTPILQTGTEVQNSHLEDPQKLQEMEIKCYRSPLSCETFLAS